MVIIGISGKRGVGKTTLADMLVKKFKFQKVSFAEDLKSLAQVIFPLSEGDLTNWKKKEAKFRHYDWTPREFLINLGAFVRYHDESYFINAALAHCDKMTGRYVFDDVRFINETEAIKSLGGVIVRLERFEDENPYGKALNVESETQLDKYQFDHIIHASRNTSLSELADQAQLIFDNYVK